MPTSCQHFAHLDRRVSDLTKKFVDDQILSETKDPISFSPDLDRLAAYRLLVHAEIEQFLEAKAREYLSVVEGWIRSGSTWMRQCPGLVALAVALNKPLPNSEHLETDKLGTFAIEVISSAKNKVAENNSIKSPAFLFLSLCAGKTIDEIGSGLSLTLNSYGKNRGDVAHKSVEHTTSIQAPSAERSTAVTIVSELALYFDVRA